MKIDDLIQYSKCVSPDLKKYYPEYAEDFVWSDSDRYTVNCTNCKYDRECPYCTRGNVSISDKYIHCGCFRYLNFSRYKVFGWVLMDPSANRDPPRSYKAFKYGWVEVSDEA